MLYLFSNEFYIKINTTTTKATMDSNIRADLYRYNGLAGRKGFLRAFFIPGFRYSFFLRKASKHKKFSLKWLLYSFLLRRYSFKYGFQIPYNTTIGKGLYIGHHGAIVINGKTQIGKNCNIAHGVTIGQANRGKSKGCPTIGDNVWIGSGSVIVGNIVIGSNVLIAPNSYVNVDVPNDSLVLGNPAKIVKKEGVTKGYVEYTS